MAGKNALVVRLSDDDKRLLAAVAYVLDLSQTEILAKGLHAYIETLPDGIQKKIDEAKAIRE